jgi:hypothetical protein
LSGLTGATRALACWAGARVAGAGSGGGIRTRDLWVMSPTSCRCSTPRRAFGYELSALGDRSSRVLAVCPTSCRRLGGWGVSAAASPPVGSPPQYSPALHWVTTGFGMGPGGSSALLATDAPHPPVWRVRALLLLHFVRRVNHRHELLPCRLIHAPCLSNLRQLSWSASGAGEARCLLLARTALVHNSRCVPASSMKSWRNKRRPRPLGRLSSSRLPAVHLPPINPVICRGPYLLSQWGVTS